MCNEDVVRLGIPRILVYCYLQEGPNMIHDNNKWTKIAIAFSDMFYSQYIHKQEIYSSLTSQKRQKHSFAWIYFKQTHRKK